MEMLLVGKADVLQGTDMPDEVKLALSDQIKSLRIHLDSSLQLEDRVDTLAWSAFYHLYLILKLPLLPDSAGPITTFCK